MDYIKIYILYVYFIGGRCVVKNMQNLRKMLCIMVFICVVVVIVVLRMLIYYFYLSLNNQFFMYR